MDNLTLNVSDILCANCSLDFRLNITQFHAAIMPVCSHSLSISHVIATSTFLALITLATMVGNLLVIASVFLERSLKTVANWLIVSLASTDLLVALLVMPLSAVNQVEGCWILGMEACNVWIFFDILCCTSSIYHLVAISFDRLWAVSSCDYIHDRSPRRILAMIAFSWMMSAVIGIPPLLGWTTPHGSELTNTGQCLISQDLSYTIFSTVGAFYLPLVAIIVVYAQVYRKARARILKKHFRKKRDAKKPSLSNITGRSSSLDERSNIRMLRLLSSDVAMDTALSPSVLGNIAKQESRDDIPDRTPSRGLDAPDRTPGRGLETSQRTIRSPVLSTLTLSPTPSGSSVDLTRNCLILGDATSESDPRFFSGAGRSPGSREKTMKRRLEQKRERKAARTLAVVTGAFVCCWLPFFVVAILRPFCGHLCHLPRSLTSVVLWLGYINSFLNPMIYTLFNPDFRTAFRKILFGSCNR